jgi:hypothetical protein
MGKPTWYSVIIQPFIQLFNQPIETKTMRTKAEVALSALEQAILLTGAAEQRRDDEFTVQEYADKIEMGIHASRRMLNDAVKAGKINVRKTTRHFFYSIA